MGGGSLGNKICGRIYVRISGVLSAPLLAGSGENNNSDNDVILDSSGTPFLPGASLAGVMRNYLYNHTLNNELKKEDIIYLFGADREKTAKGTNYEPMLEERQSRLYVYDTPLFHSFVIRRDGVRLNERKTAVDSAKYDYQAIERGAAFVIRLEILQRDQDVERETGDSYQQRLMNAQKRDLHNIELCIAGMIRGELRAGAKKHRGFGSFSVEDVKTQSFHMTDINEYKDWLNWDWEMPDAFAGKRSTHMAGENLQSHFNNKNKLNHELIIPLKIDGTLLIRQYDGEALKDGTLPDSETLKVKGVKEPVAIIPGSTWAGVFRSRMVGIIRKLTETNHWEQVQGYLDPLFGTWDMNSVRQDQSILASGLLFEESLIFGGHSLPITRNSIDRFTGGTVKGALFTENVWVGGTLMVKIQIPDMPKPEFMPWLGMLLWVAKDLQNGLLSVGGEGSVGRGIFCGNGGISLDGTVLDNQKEYQMAALKWCKCVAGGGEDEGV